MKMIEHVLAYARAYMSGLTSVATMILAYQTHLNSTEKIGLGVIAAIGSFAATAVLPSKAKGVTIAQAVTMDGEALAQATAYLKDVPLPSAAESVLSHVGEVATSVATTSQALSPVPPTDPISPDPVSPDPAVSADTPPLS